MGGHRKSTAASASASGDSGLPASKGKGKQAASEEGKILKLGSLMLESEQDHEILMKVKSEEGKILNLKREYMAAAEASLAGLSSYIEPMVKPAEPSAKKKKVVVVKTLVPPAHIAFIKAMPCPVTSPELAYTEDHLADEPQSLQDCYRRRMITNMKMRDYHQALVDQYEKFGYALDETELTDDEGEDDELTADEDDDEDNTVKN